MIYGSNGKSQGVQTICVSGVATITFLDRSLNFYTTESLQEKLKAELRRLFDAGVKKMILDYQYVKIVDSTGIGSAFIIPNNMTRVAEVDLVFCNIKPFICKILEIMRVKKHLTIFDKLCEAQAYHELNQEDEENPGGE